MQQEQVAHRLDRVQHVVQGGGELIDVLAIDGSDERGVEPPDDGVRHFVALVLAVLDPPGLQFDVFVVLDQVFQELRRATEVLRGLREQVEELLGTLRDLELHDRSLLGRLGIGST